MNGPVVGFAEDSYVSSPVIHVHDDSSPDASPTSRSLPPSFRAAVQALYWPSTVLSIVLYT